VILDLIPESTRATGLSALMKGAGMVTRFLPIPQPTLLVGPGSSGRLGQAIAGFGHEKVLIVTDAMIVKLGLLKDLTDALAAGGAKYVVFDEITPDAPIPLIERGIAFYRAPLRRHRGRRRRLLDGRRQGHRRVRSPTRASRCAAWRAISRACATRSPSTPCRPPPAPARRSPWPRDRRPGAREQAGRSSTPASCRRWPRWTRTLMTGLPPHITAATGMDALTHAVESFLGQWATPTHRAAGAVGGGPDLREPAHAYRDGGNLEAREKMALASTYAGMAFTRANVGYVHAIAHQFGGKYHTPHGLANAIMLPHVLKFSAPAVTGGWPGSRFAPGWARRTSAEDVLAQQVPRRGGRAEPGPRDSRASRGAAQGRHPGAGQGGPARGAHRLPGAALHDPGTVRGHDPQSAAACRPRRRRQARPAPARPRLRRRARFPQRNR
jgi:alcohol dehydrogenase